MLKTIAPFAQRLHHLPRPALFRARTTDHSEMTRGQRIAEHAASGIGSWRFIGAQAAVMAAWVVVNTLALTGAVHFDQYPFVFLNLAMSAEAAFTGPLLLIAANVGATRDHLQYDRMEAMERTLLAEIAALRTEVAASKSRKPKEPAS